MSVTVQTPVNSYTANGVTTVFNFSFLLLAAADLDVYVDGVLKTLTADYSVSGLEINAGGTVTFVTAPANGASVVLQRNSDIARATDYQNNGDMLAAVVNKDFDRLWLAMQEILYKYQLAPSLAPGSQLAGDIRLPEPEASKYLRWNVFENNLENADAPAITPTVESWVNTFADLGNTAATVDIVQTKGHTVAGIGSVKFLKTAGSVTSDGGTQINSLTPGYYWKALVKRYVTLDMFGCILNGIADDTLSFQLAVNSGYPIRHDHGTARITSPITSTSDLIITGKGTINASSVVGSVLKCSGNLTALPDISTVSAAAQSVTFASAHGLSVNDVFVIYNPTDYSYSGFRANYRAGEFCQVKSVSGLNVKLKGPLYAGYTGSAVDVYKLTSGVVYIDGITITGANNQPIEISKVVSPVVKNINVSCASNTAVYFDKCWSPLGKNITVNNAGVGADDYGVIFGSCQHAKLTVSNIYSRRHAVATGGDSAIGCVPNRDIRVSTSTLRNDTDSAVHCADFHGNTEDSSYEHCNIYGGVTWQGKNIHYRSCSIYAMSIGTLLYSAEIFGGDFSLIDCDLYTTTDPSAAGRGVIDVGGDSDVLTANTTSDCNFIVKDCRINGSNLTNITQMLRVRVAGSTVKVNIDYNGNKHKVNDMGSPIFASVSSGSTSPDFIIVDNCSGIPNAKLLANLSGGFASAPMRMQRCSGKSQGTTSTSSASVQVDVVFRYEYPKVPIVNVTKSLRNYNGNRIGVVVNYIPLTTGSKLGLYTDDATNFSAAQTFDFNWTAEINDV